MDTNINGLMYVVLALTYVDIIPYLRATCQRLEYTVIFITGGYIYYWGFYLLMGFLFINGCSRPSFGSRANMEPKNINNKVN